MARTLNRVTRVGNYLVEFGAREKTVLPGLIKLPMYLLPKSEELFLRDRVSWHTENLVIPFRFLIKLTAVLGFRVGGVG